MGERDWTDWGRLFDYDERCDVCRGEDGCDRGSWDPRDDSDGFHSRFVAEFVQLWSHWGGCCELDVVAEAHALLERVFLLDDLKGAPLASYERADAAGQARRAYLDWARAGPWLPTGEEEEADPWCPPGSDAWDEKSGEIDGGEIDAGGIADSAQEDEHEGRSVLLLEDETAEQGVDIRYSQDDYDLGDFDVGDIEYDVDALGVVEYALEAPEAAPGLDARAEDAALIEAHARQWIDRRLGAGPADRAAFERAAGCSYAYAGIPWHGNVIWVGSPAALVIAAQIVVFLRQRACTQLTGELRDALRVMSTEAVVSAVDAALRGAPAPDRKRCRPPRHVCWSAEQRIVTPYTVDEIIVKRVRESAGAAMEALAGSVPYRSAQRVLHAVDEAISAAGQIVQAAVHAAQAEVAARAAAAGPAGGLVVEALRSSRVQCAGAVVRDSRPCQVEVSSYLREALGLRFPRELQAHTVTFEHMARSGCWWFAHWDFLMACDPWAQVHQETLGDQGRRRQPHRVDGAAISWADGWAVHALHGHQVPAWIIEQPERLTPQAIESERNAEVRRLMIERYGWARYMADGGAEVVDQAGEDHPIVGLRGARLLRKVLPGEPEPMVCLEMRNSTPEADGTYRRYLERIDPKAYSGDAGRLCHAAMASRWRHVDEEGRLQLTFEHWRDYQPTVES